MLLLLFKRAAISVMKRNCAGPISRPCTPDGLSAAYWCSVINYLDLLRAEVILKFDGGL